MRICRNTGIVSGLLLLRRLERSRTRRWVGSAPPSRPPQVDLSALLTLCSGPAFASWISAAHSTGCSLGDRQAHQQPTPHPLRGFPASQPQREPTCWPVVRVRPLLTLQSSSSEGWGRGEAAQWAVSLLVRVGVALLHSPLASPSFPSGPDRRGQKWEKKVPSGGVQFRTQSRGGEGPTVSDWED